MSFVRNNISRLTLFDKGYYLTSREQEFLNALKENLQYKTDEESEALPEQEKNKCIFPKRIYWMTESEKTAYKKFKDCIENNKDLKEIADLTDEEQATLTQWFSSSAEEFHQKFDDYCKFIKNEKIHAENIEAERKNYKAELDRLSARAKVYTNHAERLQAALKGAMEILKVPKMKTELFTANIQNTQYKIEARAGSDLSKVPEVYLKPRELDTKTIKDAIKLYAMVSAISVNSCRVIP